MGLLRTRVSITFQDRDGNEGAMAFLLSPSLSSNDVLSFLNIVSPILEGLTNASVTGANSYQRYEFEEPNPALPGADLTSRLALFYRNEEGYEGIYVPAPKEALFTSEGPYAGIRLNVPSAAIDAFNGALADFPGTLATAEGEPFPLEYVVGGKML